MTNAQVLIYTFYLRLISGLTVTADFRELIFETTLALSQTFADEFLVRFELGVTTIDDLFPNLGDRLAKIGLSDGELFFTMRFVVN